MHHDITSVPNSSLVFNYFTEGNINIIPNPFHGSDFALFVFLFFPSKEKIEREAVTRVLKIFTLEVFQEAFMKWMERKNKYIEFGGSYICISLKLRNDSSENKILILMELL